MKIVNTTGKEVIVSNDGCFVILQPSGITAHIETGIIVCTVFASGSTVKGDRVVGLPDPYDDTMVVVTKEIGTALADSSYHNYVIAEAIDGTLMATI